MSERNFSRRRRGMRFRPAGGLSATPRQKAEAREARAATTRRDVVASEKLFERRHEHEIERAQNIAAGLPPDGVPPAPPGAAPARTAQPA